jgi:hypothetical protein
MRMAIVTRPPGGAIYQRLYVDQERSWYYSAPLSQVDQSASDFADLDFWYNQQYRAILNMLACGQAELIGGTTTAGGKTVFLTEVNWQADSCQHPLYPELLRAQITDFPAWAIDQAPYLADVRDRAITTWMDLDATGRAIRTEVRAGTTRGGMLLQAWERERDEQVPAEQAPATVFDPTPPRAQLHWRSSNQPSEPWPSPRAISLAEALDRARTPLFGLPDAGSTLRAAPGASGTPTATAELSATLTAIEAGAPPNGPVVHQPDDQAALLGALRDGYAMRLTYALGRPDSAPPLYLYEGPARELGAYLRATARWRGSAPLTVQVGGRPVAGWQVTDRNADRWTLFEVDGTLIAIEYQFDRAAEIAAGLRRLAES